MDKTQQAFIDQIAPLAQKYARPRTTDTLILPSMTIAQAIVESAWGTSLLAQHHNYFGIKANSEWSGPSISKLTGEVYNGIPQKVQASFRTYPSMEAGVLDHRKFLLRSHYSALWDETDYRKACRAIKAAGYATALDYAENLIDKIERYNLMRYDFEVLYPSTQPQPQKEHSMTRPKIFLSPSSQEHNRYILGDLTEEQYCNQLASIIEPILRSGGCDVRRNNPAETPYQHAVASNLWGADYHIPLHTNAGGGQGCEVFCYNPANRAAKSTQMAQALYDALSELTPTVDRGLKKNQTFTEIHRTTAACAYLEIDFHDTQAGARWLIDNQRKIATTIAHTILRQLGLAPAPTADRPLLRLHTIGTAVRQLQEILRSYGYQLPVTGSFDLLTEACVVHWQVNHQLTTDGIVGPKTWASFD